MSAPTAPLAVCLAGPTASGKSAAALAFAGERAVEIVSVDSALVYRGMDIGTAKPSVAERARVTHHLIDLLDPTEAYSAARFVQDARAAIDDIRARGRLPLLVGGTMLYFKALREGLDPMPAADAATRMQLEAEAAAQGWPALHAQLAEVDPLSAARLAPNDAQRIQRALEVWRVSGRPLSAWQRRDEAGDPDAAASTAERFPIVSLEPVTRAWLHQRIGERFDAMLSAGFVDELRALHARGDLHAELPAMRCVGYRQAWLDWPAVQAGRVSTLRATGVAATRQLAKRQLTWLRSMMPRTRVACDAPDALPRVLQALAAAADGATDAPC